jgi:hypothetical protein
MYLYDDFDRTLLAERVAEFRGQVARRLTGELNEDEFKSLRLMNGVYLQLHAYMLRIAIPYGTLASIRCASSPTWRAVMIAATAISPRGRTSSSTGSSLPNARRNGGSWTHACTACRRAATACNITTINGPPSRR